MSLSECRELRIGEIHIPLVKVRYETKKKIPSKYIFSLNIINYSIKVEVYSKGIVEIHLLKNDGPISNKLITNAIHLYDACIITRFCPDKNIHYASFSEKDEDKIISEFNIYTKKMINDINFFKSILSTATERYKSPNSDSE
jgi:hypothetical protein